MARPNEDSEVIGHYLVPAHGRPAQPLLHESTVLFQDVVSDKLSSVEAAVEADIGKLDQFFLVLHWASDVKGGSNSGVETGAEALDANGASAKTSVMVKQRTLLMIAAHAGSLRVLAYLLARGAEPSRKSPDGLTTYDMAVAGESSQAATALAMMRDADSHPSSSTRSSSTTETNSFNGTDGVRGGTRQDMEDLEGSLYSTTDLTRPEYSTDEFRMFNFKVLRCSKRHAHDWRACPFAHPTENARRRDPREFKYCALACPDYKQGFCIRGDICPYAHGVFECWLHPSRYRTQLCKDGSNCHRPVCFFAHSLPELRPPTYTWVPSPADIAARPPIAASATTGASTTAGGGALPGGGCASSGAAGKTPQLSGGSGEGEGAMSSRRAMPVAMGPTEGRTLLSTASSGVPPTRSSSDGTSSGFGPSCASPTTTSTSHTSSTPRTVNGSGRLSLGILSNGMGGTAGPPHSSHGSGAMGGPGPAGLTSVFGVCSSSCSSDPNGSSSPPCSVGSKDGFSLGNCNGREAGGKGGLVQSSAPGSGGKLNPNLTQPNAAASVFGFTAPRMSNAFARRHGLNPKDNPMLNLQKIALQSQQQQQAPQSPQGCALGVTSSQIGGFTQDSPNTAVGLRHQVMVRNGAADLQSAATSGLRSTSFPNGNPCANGQRLQQTVAAAAAAAVAASGASSSPGAFCSVPFSTPSTTSFGVGPLHSHHMHIHAATSHLGSGNTAESSLLAAQLAALNLQQRQQHVNIGMGMGGMSMSSGAAAVVAAAAAAGMGHGHNPVPYMTSTGHHALMHSGMYGTGGGMYDTAQQHFMVALSGTQTEV